MRRIETAGHALANLLLFAAGVILLLGAQSCASLYERAQLRFMKTVPDTTFTRVTTTIPRDSVVTVVKTDTTHYIERVKQGRATVTIIREPTNTTVIANCDSLSKVQQVPTRIEKQEWGVDPAYQQKAQRWQTIALVLIGLFVLLILLVIGLFFAYRFVFRNYSIAPKNGTGT